VFYLQSSPHYILERATEGADSLLLKPLPLYRLQKSYSLDWGPWMVSRKECERERFGVT